MRLGAARIGEQVRGVVADESGYVDISAVARERGESSGWLDGGVLGILAQGAAGLDQAAELAYWGRSQAVGVLPADLPLLAPVTAPPRIFAIGRNYADHAAEGGADVPTDPMIFFKPATAITGHGSPIIVPASTAKVDWEGELAVVVGRGGRDIPVASASEYVGGYTVANDVSARDWQRRTSQFDAGKMFDTFAPMGPLLVTPDEVGELSSRLLRTTVNGQLMQKGSLSDMIFSVPYLLHDLSRATRLRVGDIILTGTPAGVGYARTPPLFLQDGDVVSISIDGVGVLTNEVMGADRARASGIDF